MSYYDAGTYFELTNTVAQHISPGAIIIFTKATSDPERQGYFRGMGNRIESLRSAFFLAQFASPPGTTCALVVNGVDQPPIAGNGQLSSSQRFAANIGEVISYQLRAVGLVVAPPGSLRLRVTVQS
jgi:hypothetical protein